MLKIVTNGYGDLEAAAHSMENYCDKTADIRLIAFMAQRTESASRKRKLK